MESGFESLLPSHSKLAFFPWNLQSLSFNRATIASALFNRICHVFVTWKDIYLKLYLEGLVNLLVGLPHGVIVKHPEMKDLVETSTNLAIIHTHSDHAQIICSSRSSVASALEATRNTIAALSELSGAQINQPEGYPGWTPNLESPLLKTLKDVYRKTFQKDPQVGAIHAGLECGIIGEKFPGMDMIPFGPTIEHPHSPEERVHIGSV